MKRADIVKNVEYAVLAPGQRAKVGRRYGPRAKRVRVLDTRARHIEYSSWGSRDYPERKLEGFGDDGEVKVTDYTTKVDDGTYGAGRGVKCLVGEERYRHSWNSDDHAYTYRIAVVPVSQVAMTWAEYEELREAAEAETKREEARERARESRERKAKAEREAQRDADMALVRSFLGTTDAVGAIEAFERLHPSGSGKALVSK